MQARSYIIPHFMHYKGVLGTLLHSIQIIVGLLVNILTL